MAQTDVNRLLLLPALVLAAALALTGCANLPFFGGDSGSSNGSSSSKDDDEDDDEEEDDDEVATVGSCPQEFLDATKTQMDSAETGFDELSITEIDPRLFEPAVVGDIIDGGCIFVVEYSQDGTDGTLFEAFVPGGQDLKDEIDQALVADGFDNSTESIYIGDDNEYVIVYSNDEGMFTQDQIDEQGLGVLGDEFLIITAYKAQV